MLQSCCRTSESYSLIQLQMNVVNTFFKGRFLFEIMYIYQNQIHVSTWLRIVKCLVILMNYTKRRLFSSTFVTIFPLHLMGMLPAFHGTLLKSETVFLLPLNYKCKVYHLVNVFIIQLYFKIRYSDSFFSVVFLLCCCY